MLRLGVHLGAGAFYINLFLVCYRESSSWVLRCVGQPLASREANHPAVLSHRANGLTSSANTGSQWELVSSKHHTTILEHCRVNMKAVPLNPPQFPFSFRRSVCTFATKAAEPRGSDRHNYPIKPEAVCHPFIYTRINLDAISSHTPHVLHGKQMTGVS
jgi:hypothetical protein